ncbi:MAG: zinc-binding alcohol dehydrogenase family protein [Bacteroidota bacterium]|nr:zinc-binding alcohol dehydrogenase family protein [Bacteroidota bacterium]
MEALVCTKPGKLDYADIAEPVLERGHAIIRIRKIGICGTDLHAFEGTQPFFNYPRILGHELSGELVDFDNAPGFRKGEAVSFIPYLNCGSCFACRNGKTNCCENLQTCGVHIDGGMVDFYSIPCRLLIHADGLDLTSLAMVEPMAIGAHGIRRASLKPGEFVMVMGAGPIGLAAMEFARLQGAEIIVTDINHFRLDFCKTQLGISHIIHAGDNDIEEQLSEITGGDMPAVVIDASGNRKAINNGLNYLAHGGRYILIGLQKGELVFSHPEFHKKEATLMSSRNATREDFDHVMQSMKNGLINPISFITHRVKFKDAASAFPDWLNPSGHTIKAVVEND